MGRTCALRTANSGRGCGLHDLRSQANSQARLVVDPCTGARLWHRRLEDARLGCPGCGAAVVLLLACLFYLSLPIFSCLFSHQSYIFEFYFGLRQKFEFFCRHALQKCQLMDHIDAQLSGRDRTQCTCVPRPQLRARSSTASALHPLTGSMASSAAESGCVPTVVYHKGEEKFGICLEKQIQVFKFLHPLSESYLNGSYKVSLLLSALHSPPYTLTPPTAPSPLSPLPSTNRRRGKKPRIRT
jgi:hypothetical protein